MSVRHYLISNERIADLESPRSSARASRLEVLESVAIAAGAEHLAVQARALQEQVKDGLFYVACVGQFKRGKSTLLNALIGEAVLPAGVAPVTTVITILRHGSRRVARIRLRDGGVEEIDPRALEEYVSERENPENSKGLAAVEVFTPSALLEAGMCLVDTPGIGSVFLGNTRETQAFVPRIDAALVVLGADPPISADELALVAQISEQCRNLIFTLNKVDKLTDVERTEATEFTKQVLSERAGMNQVELFEVSALDCLNGNGPSRDWPKLHGQLEILSRDSRSELVMLAERRGVAQLENRLRFLLEEERGALLRPIAESRKRIEGLRVPLAEAERSLSDLDYLLAAEQDRLGRVFREKRDEFLRGVQAEARRQFAQAVRSLDLQRGPGLRRKAIELAQEISRAKLDAWLSEVQPVAEALYVQVTQRFVVLANEFWDKLAQSGEATVAELSRRLSPEVGFRTPSGLYYTFLMTQTSQSPAAWVLDRLRSREGQLAEIERTVGAYLETLLFTNANRIANDFNERLLESRRTFQLEIRNALAEVASTTRHALARAEARLSQGSQAIDVEIRKIDFLCAQIDDVGH